MLLSIDYLLGTINGAIAKARGIPRQKELLQVLRRPINSRPTFVVLYDPRLPNISDITTRHWRLMVSQEEYLKSVFPEPHLVSFRRQKNVRETIKKDKLAPERQASVVREMKKCGNCLACSYIKEGKTVKGISYHRKKFIWKIGRPLYVIAKT